jgi:DNA-binding NarL/FixJ family response regulator
MHAASYLADRLAEQPSAEEANMPGIRICTSLSRTRSNVGIAHELVVTVAAVERHVTSIFDKLGLHQPPEQHRRVLAVLKTLRA